MMRLYPRDQGKRCLVWFDQSGREDGMIVDLTCGFIKVFLFDDRLLASVTSDQILEVGEYIEPQRPKDVK